MRLFVARKVLYFSASLFFIACAADIQETALTISPGPTPTQLDSSPSQQLARLNKVAPENSPQAKLVKDIRLLLKAQVLQDKSQYNEAAKAYYAALKESENAFAKEALIGWVQNYARSLEQKTKASFIAKLLLDISNNGKASRYMQKRGLTNIKSLTPFIIEHAKEYILRDKDVANAEFPTAPQKKGISSKDPLLKKTAETYCSGSGKPNFQWEAWIKTLEKPVQNYWQAMVLECKGERKKALRKFQKTIPSLFNKKTANLAVHASYRYAKLSRYNASREDAARGYITLMNAWSQKGLTAAKMDMKPRKFVLEQINDALWAGRYRSLIGDYQNGKIYTNRALKLISSAYTKRKLLNRKMKEELANYKAEAYLILANRIAVEEKDASSAASQMLIASKIPNLKGKLKEKTYWYAGLFQYIDGQYTNAIKRWETLLKKTKDDSTKAQIYFWLAKAYKKVSDTKTAESYLKRLSEDYPLGYYNVIASRRIDGIEAPDWAQNFSNYDEMVESLLNKKTYILPRISSKLENKIQKAEILIVSKLYKWARLTVNEIDRAFTKKHSVRKNVEAFIYLSRLHFAAENYLKSITITTKLRNSVENFWKKWPEQLLIYYPRPYSDIYSRNSTETTVKETLLYSISRQESAFNPQTTSFANAYGLMQLILPTAERFAKISGFEIQGLEPKLYEPEVNIKIGSHYLKKLRLDYKQFTPAIYAAYNAGEYAVDVWLERRAHTDPLVWIELIPFGETRGYVKNVWRNQVIYDHIAAKVNLASSEFKANHLRFEHYSFSKERFNHREEVEAH